MCGHNPTWVSGVDKQDKSGGSDDAEHKEDNFIFIVDKGGLFFHGFAETLLHSNKWVEKISEEKIIGPKISGQRFW